MDKIPWIMSGKAIPVLLLIAFILLVAIELINSPNFIKWLNQ